MCCYDGGDCPVAVFYDPLPAKCNNDACDHAKLGDGICDKKDKDVCCMDQLDCVNTRQVWDDLTCETMSSWTLYDTCPLCCNVSNDYLYLYLCRPKRGAGGRGARHSFAKEREQSYGQVIRQANLSLGKMVPIPQVYICRSLFVYPEKSSVFIQMDDYGQVTSSSLIRSALG